MCNGTGFREEAEALLEGVAGEAGKMQHCSFCTCSYCIPLIIAEETAHLRHCPCCHGRQKHRNQYPCSSCQGKGTVSVDELVTFMIARRQPECEVFEWLHGSAPKPSWIR